MVLLVHICVLIYDQNRMWLKGNQIAAYSNTFKTETTIEIQIRQDKMCGNVKSLCKLAPYIIKETESPGSFLGCRGYIVKT